MYAVVRTGGKQYRVAEGDLIKVEKIQGTPGESIDLDEVLLIAGDGATQVGRPLVAGARVNAEIVDQDKNRKILVFKYKRRKRYRRKAGHRQPFTALRITGITAPAAAPADEPAPIEDPQPPAEQE